MEDKNGEYSRNLKYICENYFAIWNEPARFRALLMDYFPQNKLLRNLLYHSVEEHIPQEIFGKDKIINIEIAVYKERLIRACGCSDDWALDIVNMWLDALGVDWGINDKNAEEDDDFIYFDEIEEDDDFIDFDEIEEDDDFIDSDETGKCSDAIDLDVTHKKSEGGVKESKILDEMEIAQMVVQKEEEGDYPGFIEALAKWVEAGHNEIDYAVIGHAYLLGIKGVPPDFEKGFEWLRRFYRDYKDGNVQVDDQAVLLSTANNLAMCYLMKQENDDDLRMDVVIGLLKEAIDYGADLVGKYCKREVTDMLINAGRMFAGGKIQISQSRSIELEEDYEYAFKAFSEAERLGNHTATEEIAEMREKLLDLSVDELMSTTHGYNYLKRAGINTVRELCNKTPEDMGKVRNLGRKNLEEILIKLKNIGLGLRPADE